MGHLWQFNFQFFSGLHSSLLWRKKKCMEIRCKSSLGYIASSNAAVVFDGFWHTLQRKVEEENNMQGHGRNVQRTSFKAVNEPLLISSICQSNLMFTLFTADTSYNWRDEEDAGRGRRWRGGGGY
jgi:hypothetical protein